jgi:hypothetical protein
MTARRRDLWVRMAEASKEAADLRVPSTHPSEETRIRQIDGWMAEAMRQYKPRPWVDSGLAARRVAQI